MIWVPKRLNTTESHKVNRFWTFPEFDSMNCSQFWFQFLESGSPSGTFSYDIDWTAGCPKWNITLTYGCWMGWSELYRWGWPIIRNEGLPVHREDIFFLSFCLFVLWAEVNLWSEMKVSRSTVRMWLSMVRTQDTDLLFRLKTWKFSSKWNNFHIFGLKISRFLFCLKISMMFIQKVGVW